SDYCIKDLKNQMTENGAIDMSGDEWLKEGAGPKPENFSVFLINKNNITFYFGDYQVAAYAAGDFTVVMPR
ncbi:MAG: RsiV family protein, partial [Candidatus Staskawiczbacteria bacterium]|nr:RsiV family protein [Candidatus Staskawiczbacteria bacterium]